MNMNNKLKAVIALAVLGVSGQTQATIDPGTSGNGELFFTIWGDGFSYTKDLGVSMDTFITSGNPSQQLGYSFSADANWASFVSQVGGISNPSLQWNVGALDTTGGAGFGRQRFLTTSGNTLADFAAQTNGSLTTGFSLANNFLNAVNFTGTHVSQADGSSVNSVGTDPNAYSATWYGNDWAGKAMHWTSSGAVDSSLSFFYLTPSNTSAVQKATVTQFGLYEYPSTWTMTSSGTLWFATPVPVPAAVWLLGSALVGWVGGVRRKDAAESYPDISQHGVRVLDTVC